MDLRWEHLRVSLLQDVESAEAEQEFAELSATLKTLGISAPKQILAAEEPPPATAAA